MSLFSSALRMKGFPNTPNAPADGSFAVYFKNDGILYTLNPDGEEVAITPPASGGGGGAGSLLGLVSYAPPTNVIRSTIVPGNILGDVDAANVSVTFTAPDSGQVLVRLSAFIQSASGIGFFGVRSPTAKLGVAQVGSTGSQHRSVPLVVSGLTPGSENEFRFAIGTSGSSLALSYGIPTTNPAGPIVMEVWAA